MKSIILQLVIIFGLTVPLLGDDLASTTLTTNEENDVRQKLEAFEKGSIDLDETSGTSSMDGCQEIIDYYLLHTNDVSIKMKLPISRCFAALDKYPEAATLATEYVQVYSNDWRGWKILGGADFQMGNYNAAIGSLTNSARLGDNDSYAALGLAALRTERLDVFQEIIPHLFALKRSKPTNRINPLDTIMLLVGYSLKVNQQDLFIKALDGVSANQILSRDDLKQLVETGCERFKGKDIDKIRQELESAASPTNSISSPPP
jgi:tetratricopeptide (TPR) repeat protein